MKIHNLLLLALATAPALAQSQDSSYLGIFAETHQTIIAGMKQRQMPKLPPGISLPPSVRAMMPGGPKRMLTVRLWSPGLAPDSATASIVPPSGLQLGQKLDLDIFRPKPAQPAGGGGGTGSSSSNGAPPDLTIKFYWGSSDTVQPGQPKIFNLATMTPGQQMEMASHMKGMNPMASGGASGGNYFYKDGWTTGYWPTDAEPGDIPDNASMAGTFNLNTSFAGNCTIDAPSNVDFLAPITMTSPDLSVKPALDAALAFQWNQIPNALGEYAKAIGFEGKSTLIIWSSADVFDDTLLGNTDYMQMSEVNDAVSKHIFMPGDSTHMTIPAGIFANSEMMMLNMVGYGPGSASSAGSPVPRIQTKTTLSVMVNNKKGR